MFKVSTYRMDNFAKALVHDFAWMRWFFVKGILHETGHVAKESPIVFSAETGSLGHDVAGQQEKSLNRGRGPPKTPEIWSTPH